MFRRDRLVDLVADGHHFQGSAPAAFFRRERLEREGIRFDDRIQPAFEDAHFTIRYLLSFDRPMVGFLQSAQYHYRKRSDGSSTLQTSRAHPGRYTAMLELRLPRRRAPGARAPRGGAQLAAVAPGLRPAPGTSP